MNTSIRGESTTPSLRPCARRCPCNRLRHLFSILTLALLISPLAHAARGAQAQAAPPTLALVGGTVIDVSQWGHSANDLPNAVVLIRDGQIVAVGSMATLPVPKGANVVDCTGKYLVPGLVDGYGSVSNQGEAQANLYMGVTTVVARSSAADGAPDLRVSPGPQIYRIASVGTTDSLNPLRTQPAWRLMLQVTGAHPVELTPAQTAQELSALAQSGVRAVLIGPAVTAANTQWILEHARGLGLATYGVFAATPVRLAVKAGVDTLLHMGRYEIGVIPDELQQPLADDAYDAASRTAYGYAEHLPPMDPHLHDYARFLAAHRTVLMPTFSEFFLRLPDHRNLWKEPAARLLNPHLAFGVTDPATGEMVYPLTYWEHKLPQVTQRWLEVGLSKRANQQAQRLWSLNQSIFEAYPHYLAGSGAPAMGSLPGISLQVELEMLVRLGLSPREALAAATNNYALQMHWTELGGIVPGRRADILVLDADPTASVWNLRRFHTLVVNGIVMQRESLLQLGK